MKNDFSFKRMETSVHELKELPKYYQDVMNGYKTFEVRENDREFKVNDILILEEWDSVRGYTGRKLPKRIVYILDDEEYCKEGFVVLGIR